MIKAKMTIFFLIISTCSVFAFSPVGKYKYKEKGYAGEMVVTQVGVYPLVHKIAINTYSKSSYHTCELEAIEIDRIADSKTISSAFEERSSDGDAGGRFSIDFSPKGAEIYIESPSGFCGMDGDYSGKWEKHIKK